MSSPISIYFHIPFCLHKCPYCDFNTYAVSKIPEQEYATALLAELDFRLSQPEWQESVVDTIYFGGGTPSLFETSTIGKLLNFIYRRLRVKPDVEVSLEANPGTVSLESLRALLDLGINRISFGAQSFQSNILKALGRMHTPVDTLRAVESARHAGFRNLSVDLMYGAPEQTLDHLREDLDIIRDIAPQHISAYSLTVEKGTPYYFRYRSGRLPLPTEDSVIEMMNLINSDLPAMGLTRYEISNFSRPGFEARHNLAYWNIQNYLGVGAGAHSYCKYAPTSSSPSLKRRWSNFALPNKYIAEAMSAGSAESWSEELSEKDSIFEFFFLGLRKTEGVSLQLFEETFGKPVYEVYPTLIKVLSQQGFLTTRSDYLSLSDKGLRFADTVIENFLEEDHPLPDELSLVPEAAVTAR